ncbi:aldo/keto reductase [Sinorhizobium meliloti]|uniref:aldo/keto reductase n=1 Tax=Rhizobium meliloti TaxID=382 RepID=UPI000FDAB52B|nr:aldo/keto reductase [Sinorhizobium meliloti]MDW9587631.1 aldo/keto reductase [Sinorhizobium meliloti]MDW9852276.1 aldo/keto reductase [Sinorhizobium meliloti]MDW9870501.1 aldo/keto reductase [Sinorhizobium meliloti]MDW9883144.1 aldo/keto reductase [Sinorhizobium meliloti]MDX0205333.1 aldo/keto reductase [Sinorhizobium meliloti]
MSLDQYYLLGRSGLRVSRLALGTMTFGNAGIRGIGGSWGSDEVTARAIFHRYVEAGGNFIDTADSYAGGMSESLVGSFVAEAGLRDHMVIATKFSNNVSPGDPNAGGNGRKNIMRAIDASLKRLKTDYIDLYLLHTWDRMTPVEEVMRTLDDLVRAGKIRHAGLSDVPAWYAARAQTWAESHALSLPVCLQLPYSLVERSIEHEFVPLAETLGLGITAWSPLAMGLLSGKYRSGAQAGRLALDVSGTGLGLFNERNARIVAALEATAATVGRSMAQVALNWGVNRPGVAAAIVGASRLEQLDDNLASLDFELAADQRAALDVASAIDAPYPYSLFADDYQAGILNTGSSVGEKPRSYRSDNFLPKVTDYVFGQPKNQKS